MLSSYLIFLGVVILMCVMLNNASFRIGMPVLLAFILFGLIIGNFLFPDDQYTNFPKAGNVCTMALIFIIFYGGFGTNWKTAKKVAVEAGLLASLGVVTTALITGLICHFLLHWNWIESLLFGAVISSTDAASVFSILRGRKLGLKNHTAPMIEMESGSNDPFSNILTVMMLSLMTGEMTAGTTLLLLFKQIFFGVLIGFLIAKGAIYVMKKVSFATSGFDSLFILAVAMMSYAVPDAFGGNGYLSAYLVGIIVGNANFQGKKQLVNFFDGVTGFMQVMIFFLLGMLANPASLARVLVPAILLFLAITFVSRPLSIFGVLLPFKKYPISQIGLVSFAGLRGASSIVFAIMAVSGNGLIENDIFSVVFVIVLLSIALQGSFLPNVAKQLKMIDKNSDVMKTFTDFSDETDLHFSQVLIEEDDAWNGKMVKNMNIPRNVLICLCVKADGSRFVPNGKSVLEKGDTVILCAAAAAKEEYIHIVEHPLSKNSRWAGRMVKEYPSDGVTQLVLIKRGDKTVVPNGNTVLLEGDILFINKG